MNERPALTVGVPVYNGERYVERAVRSVLGQSFEDFELIISDNASTDATGEICRSIAAGDPRVTYRRNRRNIGLAGNNNLLVHLARGRYFKWAPCDDELKPGYLERCIAALEQDSTVVLAYPQTDFIDGEGQPLDIVDAGWPLGSSDIAERLRFAVTANGWVNAVLGVTRTEAIRRTRLMRRYAGSDYRLMTELAVLGKIVEVPEHLYLRRIHQGSSAGNNKNPGWMRTYYSGARSELRVPYWRLSMDRAEIVLRAPIPLGDRISVLGTLARSLVTRRIVLYRDLRDLWG